MFRLPHIHDGGGQAISLPFAWRRKTTRQQTGQQDEENRPHAAPSRGDTLYASALDASRGDEGWGPVSPEETAGSQQRSPHSHRPFAPAPARGVRRSAG